MTPLILGSFFVEKCIIVSHYQSDSIIQHCIFILHEICYGLGYLMMGRYAYTFHGETFRRDVRLAGRDTEIGPLFGTERTGAIAGIPSGSFADEE